MSTNLPPKIASDMAKTSKRAPKSETEKSMQRLVGDDAMADDEPAKTGEAILKRAASQNDRKSRNRE